MIYRERLEGLTWDEYRALEIPSQSDLKAVWDDPQLWFEQNVTGKVPKPESSPSQRWGINCEQTLKLGRINDVVQVIPPSVLTSNGHRRGKAWETFKADQPEHIEYVTEAEYERDWYGFERALANVKEHRYARSLLDGVEWNVRYQWIDDSEFVMKGELDCLSVDGRYVVDVKTTARNTPRDFERDIAKWGYDIQAAAYMEACGFNRFYWVVIQNCAPWRVETYTLGEYEWQIAEKRLEARKQRFQECVESGFRSATHNELVELSLPNYLTGGLL